MAFTDDAIRGYAEAFAAVAEAEGVLDKVEDELFAFGKALEQQPELREALTDAAIPAENRKAVVRDDPERPGPRRHGEPDRVRGRVGARARTWARSSQAVSAIAAERREHQLAEVRSAVPLDEAQRARLAAALSAATGPVDRGQGRRRPDGRRRRGGPGGRRGVRRLDREPPGRREAATRERVTRWH